MGFFSPIPVYFILKDRVFSTKVHIYALTEV